MTTTPAPARAAHDADALARRAAPLAQVERGGVVESVHLGHLVVTGADGRVLAAVGDPDAAVYARSCLKPLQVAGMLQAGLWPEPAGGADGAGGGDAAGGVDQRWLALAAASHNGEPEHVAVVREVLAAAGLGEADLGGTPDLPLHAPTAAAWQARGNGPSSLVANCSGKHAAMLTTCVVRGWPLEGYLDPAHPVQAAVLAAVAERTGEPLGGVVSTDGCGTPLPLVPLAALARSYAALARPAGAAGAGGVVDARVGAAMRAHPFLVGGQGRQASLVTAGVPGLVAKDGAEGVFALALPDGRAAALKVLDGAVRPFPVVLAAVLAALGVRAPVVGQMARVPVLGHGREVGALTAAAGLADLLAAV